MNPTENVLSNLGLWGKNKNVLSNRWSQGKTKVKEHLILAPVTRESHVPKKSQGGKQGKMPEDNFYFQKGPLGFPLSYPSPEASSNEHTFN